MTKIDIFPHILPKPYFDKMLSLSDRSAYMQKRVRAIPVMYDLDIRFRIMEQYQDYAQVLTLNLPPIEVVAGPRESPDLAKLANDSMAELVAKHPKHFPAFVASLPLNNPDATLREAERAVKDLDARGVQIGSNVNGRPLDEPEFRPLLTATGDRILVREHRNRPGIGDNPNKTRAWCRGTALALVEVKESFRGLWKSARRRLR